MGAGPHDRRLGLQRRLLAAIAIAAAAAVVEILGSWLSGSLALLSDAAHVGTDAFALGLSLWALRVSGRPHTPAMSFGYHRMEVLAALANGGLLVAIAGYLAVQAYGRYMDPLPIQGGIMFSVGLAGLLANVTMLALLRGWAKRNINARGAFLHVYGDTLGSVGVVGAAFIVSLILLSAARLLRDAVRIVLEATPAELRPQEIANAILAVPGVRGAHDLHVWTVTSGLYALTGHILASGDGTAHHPSHLLASPQPEMPPAADLARKP